MAQMRFLLCVAVSALVSCTAPRSARESCEPPRDLYEFHAAIRSAEIWTGGPADLERYESVGRNSLATAIRAGLMPNHKILDVGAGSLRVGWWLLQYVDRENYYAIEPNAAMIDGAAEILCEDLNVWYNDDFEFPSERFDFVIARSIWTHASKSMIAKMLAEFAENSKPDATFLTSVMFPDESHPDYLGTTWRGKSHQSKRVGLVRHSLEWIESECSKHGLTLEVGEQLYGQTWLSIRRADATTLDGFAGAPGE